MKKGLLNYVTIISIIMIIILNSTTSIYAYNILGNNDKTLDILIINSYDSKNEWENHIITGFEEKLKEIKPKDLSLNIDLEYLDIRKRNDKAYLDSFNDLLNKKYQYKDIDIVFAIDDGAFEFVKSKVLNSQSVLYHKQILFTGVNNPVELTGEYKKYITGILQANTDQLFNLILYLHPNVDTINIIIDEFIYSNVIKKRVESSKSLFFRPVKINFIQSNYIEDIENKLKKINDKNQAIVLTGTFMYKSNKSHVKLKDIVNDIKKITDNPIYTNNYAYVFNGVIGGFVDIGEHQGSYVAKEICNILEGNKIEEGILPKSSGMYIFDYKQIYNYNIDILKMPKDSKLLNKPKYALLLPKPLKITVCIVFSLLILILVYVVYKFIIEIKKSNKNKKLYERAKEREQLKTDFIVNMSHELRTPLNVILSTSKVAELKINTNNYDNKYLLGKLEQINKNSNRLLKLVNNLIDITKFEQGVYEINLENINIVEVVEDIVLASVDYATYKNIDLVFDTEEEEIITAIDKDKIERVILNLLSNAIKFTHKGGSIYVYIKREKDKVFISVEDNGMGIPKDKINEIFNRFYQVSDTLKKHEEGSGIGLCIVEEIVDLHGGKINVYSEVNKGSKFEIILPIYMVEENFKNLQIKDIQQIVKLEMSDVDTKEN